MDALKQQWPEPHLFKAIVMLIRGEKQIKDFWKRLDFFPLTLILA